MPELTAEQVERLSGGLEQASKDLTGAREEMAKYNTKVGELLAEQEALRKDAGNSGVRLDKISSELENLAARMQSLGEQYTNLLGQQRQSMRILGHEGASEDRAYVYRHPNSRGTIFESKQQAIEVGMFFMATMSRDCGAKHGARRWLREHQQDLRYLPVVPKSFVEEFEQGWLKTYQDATRGLATQALTGGATPGSVLCRPEFANTLIRNVEEHGAFRQEALIWPMGADTVYIPRRSGGFTVYWEGEAEAPTASDPAFQLLGMTAKKMMILHQYSSELAEDAAIALADILVFEVALAIATEEDRIGFNGTGTGGVSPGFAGFVGVLGSARNGDTDFTPIAVTGAANADLTSEITAAKLRAMTGQLHTWSRAGAKWYMHRTVLADCDGIAYTNGPSVVSYREGRSVSIMGYPVREVEGMPASADITQSMPVLALGDLRRCWVLGDRRQVEIQTSEHYAFNTDQLTMRATARVGFLRLQGNGMVVYVTGTT
jgi:HK97 family phage major capsid protein